MHEPTDEFPENLRELAAFLMRDHTGAACLLSSTGYLLCANQTARDLFSMNAKVAGRRLDTILPDTAVKAYLKVVKSSKAEGAEIPWKAPLVSSFKTQSSLHIKFELCPKWGEQKLIFMSVNVRMVSEGQHDLLVEIETMARRVFDPLTVINGYCEILQGQVPSPALAQIQKSVEKISAGMAEMRRKLQAILADRPGD